MRKRYAPKDSTHACVPERTRICRESGRARGSVAHQAHVRDRSASRSTAKKENDETNVKARECLLESIKLHTYHCANLAGAYYVCKVLRGAFQRRTRAKHERAPNARPVTPTKAVSVWCVSSSCREWRLLTALRRPHSAHVKKEVVVAYTLVPTSLKLCTSLSGCLGRGGRVASGTAAGAADELAVGNGGLLFTKRALSVDARTS